MSSPLDFHVTKGDDFSKLVTFKTRSEGVDTAIDFSDWSAVLRVTKPGGVVEILGLASGVGFTINSQGQMIVPLSDTLTDTLTPGVYKIGVRFTNPDGLITTLVSSRFVVYPELTVLHECLCEDSEVVICADPDVVVIVGPGIPGPAGNVEAYLDSLPDTYATVEAALLDGYTGKYLFLSADTDTGTPGGFVKILE